ncbi:MAG: hypothetical protein WCY15_12345 [Phenylobacterium sp.]|jgi:hypothetical protein|uniref:hypothetical protein n=1 Tax=Phenylobacterium sp. TaxID=1871053 RepID=UPI002A25D7CE|nr:hypothetical protein [Phenylobacterium sp.]MDD3837077.1 hypothetical protein [Phenylobacterium sp.]MDX9996367.1 hypothetical protein [Phenylobacterium sp.]
MARWLFLLGGMIVWLVHFLGAYGVASAADVITGQADAAGAVWGVGLLTLACAGADVALLALALPRARSAADGLDRFLAGGAALGAGLSLLAVVWQGLPVLTAK